MKTLKGAEVIDQLSTSPLKNTAVRGVEMLAIGFIMKIGLTIIVFLALTQFFWMLFANKRNSFIAELGVTIRECYSEAISFRLVNSDSKPFP